MSEDRKLLQPFSSVVSVVLRLLVGVLGATFVVSLFSKDVSFLGSDGGACITDGSTSAGSTGGEASFVPQGGAQVYSVPRYCADDPSGYQQVLVFVDQVLPFVLLLGGLLILDRLLRGAVREGVYTLRTAARMRILGWWLLLGALLSSLGQAFSQTALLATLAQEVTFPSGDWLTVWSPPYLAILTGVGLLTFAQITRAGVSMREDLEGVV